MSDINITKELKGDVKSFFCVLLWLILYISLYFLCNINISGIGWLVGGSFMSETFLTINVTV